MVRNGMRDWVVGLLMSVLMVGLAGGAALGEGTWEVTPQGEAAVKQGLMWLTANQGSEGNWESKDLGLVGMGALAYLAAGETSGVGQHGKALDRALGFMLRSAKPSGLLNIGNPQHDMYNHGLSTFVLGQAYGMTNDRRIGPVLDRALKLIQATQCNDGGWDYGARSQERGHDLSLVVMQAKALRSAVDSGFEVQPQVIAMAIRRVRGYYCPANGRREGSEAEQQEQRGAFSYEGGPKSSTAMAAAGVVCMQEFGQYDDWRIPKSMETVIAAIQKLPETPKRSGNLPFDAYTMYYVGQALYQVGGKPWQENYPKLREYLVASQAADGSWRSDGWGSGGKGGQMYATSVACFILSMPNRYLPILQEGKIEGLGKKYQAPAP